jgi:hypothetical protein
MDDFARRPADDRRAYIEEAAAHRDLTPIIIEKDFGSAGRCGVWFELLGLQVI